MSSEKPRFCVMGAGHGGTAMAAHLALKGFEVNLYNRSEERLIPVKERGNIELLAPGLDDVEGGLAPIKLATTDAGEALCDADIVMVVVPATAHSFVAEAVAPHVPPARAMVNPALRVHRKQYTNRPGCELTKPEGEVTHNHTPK